MSLAENDILKLNDIYKLPLYQTLNFLAYRIERDNVVSYKQKLEQQSLR